MLRVALALAAALPLSAAAQDVADRLAGHVPADAVPALADIARGAGARGLPVEPLIQKAIEGGAKGVPTDRVIAAVRALAARLEQARGALGAAGLAAPSPEAVEGGADALNTGLSGQQIGAVARLSQPPYEPAMTLRVAATLAALGVPPTKVVELLQRLIQAGLAPNDLLDLPSETQTAMAQGATPAQAVEGLGRGVAHAVRPPHPPPQGHPNPRKP